MKSSFLRFLSALFNQSRSPRSVRGRKASSSRRKSYPLSLEMLEARDVPTVLFTPAFGPETLAAGHFLNHGIVHPTVNLIFSGNNWNTANEQPLKDAVNSILTGPYLSGLTQYGYGGTAQLGASWTDAANLTSVDPASMQLMAPTGANYKSLLQGYLQNSITNHGNVSPGTNDWQHAPIYVVISDRNTPQGDFLGVNDTGIYNQVIGNYPFQFTIAENMHMLWVGTRNTTAGVFDKDDFTLTLSHELAERISQGDKEGILVNPGPRCPTDFVDLNPTTGRPKPNQIADFEPAGANYGCRVNGYLVQAYWSDHDQAFLVPDGNTLTIRFDPQWSGATLMNYHLHVQASQVTIRPNTPNGLTVNAYSLVNGWQSFTSPENVGPYGDLSPVNIAEVDVAGLGNGSTLTVDDRADAMAGARLTMNPGSINVNSSTTIYYDTHIQNVYVDASDLQASVVNVRDSRANVTYTQVHAGAAATTINAYFHGSNGEHVGQLDVVGKANTTLNILDSTTSFPGYTLSDGRVTEEAGLVFPEYSTITYDGVGNLRVLGNNFAIFDVFSTSAGTATQIYAGGAYVTINAYFHDGLGHHLGQLDVVGRPDTTLNVLDSGSIFPGYDLADGVVTEESGLIFPDFGYMTYESVGNLKVTGGDLAIFNVFSTSDGTATQIDAGGAYVTINAYFHDGIGHHLGQLDVVGRPDTTLNILDSGSIFPGYDLAAGVVTEEAGLIFPDFGYITYEGVGNLKVTGGDLAIFNVFSTSDGTATQIDAGGTYVTINAYFHDGIGHHLGQLDVVGRPDTTLNILDSGSIFPGYDLAAGVVTEEAGLFFPDFGYITYEGVGNLKVTGGDLAIFNVFSTSDGTTTQIDAAGGLVTINAYFHDGIGHHIGQLDVVGQPDTTLNILDLANGFPIYTLAAGRVTQDAGLVFPDVGTITYAGIGSLTVMGDTGIDTFNVLGTGGAAQTNIVGSPYQNTFYVGDDNNLLDNIVGGLQISGQGTSTLILNDRAVTQHSPDIIDLGVAFTITDGSVVRSHTEADMLGQTSTFTQTITYSGMQSLVVEGGSTDTTYDVQSTAPGTDLSISTGGSVNRVSAQLGGLGGNLQVQGGVGGSTALVLDDSANAAPMEYDLAVGSVGWEALGSDRVTPQVGYVNLSGLTLRGSSGGSTIFAEALDQVFADLGNNLLVEGPAQDWIGQTLATTISLQSSSTAPRYGDAVTLTATVGSVTPGLGMPAGIVTFFDNGVVIGTASLDANGQASMTTTGLVAGDHAITASYDGEGFFQGSTSDNLTQTIMPAATQSTITTSLAKAVFGQAVTFTAAVSTFTPGLDTPTGTVTFMDGNTVLGSVALSGVVASLTVATLAPGTHSITAVFVSGTGNFAGSTAAALSQVVQKASTTTTLSGPTTAVSFGKTVTLTAKITLVAPGAGTPTGTVTFKDGSTVLGTGTLANGVATFQTCKLSKGKHTITAVYAGDAHDLTSTSLSVVVTIQ